MSQQPANTTQPALQLSNVSKVYPNGFQALQDINICVEQGDFFAFLGANGAGKSTTIGIVSSLLKATSGQILINGIDLAKDPSQAKKNLGVVPQEFNFGFFDKVLDIVVTQAGYFGIPKKEALKRAELYLKKLELWDKRNEQARSLSGGMKRRLMIARAMMHQPKLLILDEPSAGVDIEIRRNMWEFLQEINQQGTTIILTTHYLEEAEMLCKNIAIVKQGRIIEQTSMKKVLAQLNNQTFVIDVNQPLQQAPVITDATTVLVDDYSFEVTTDKNITLNHVFAELTIQSIEVSSMRNKTNRLESLFIELVS